MTTKKCSHCLFDIPEQADICGHCGREQHISNTWFIISRDREWNSLSLDEQIKRLDESKREWEQFESEQQGFKFIALLLMSIPFVWIISIFWDVL